MSEKFTCDVAENAEVMNRSIDDSVSLMSGGEVRIIDSEKLYRIDASGNYSIRKISNVEDIDGNIVGCGYVKEKNGKIKTPLSSENMLNIFTTLDKKKIAITLSLLSPEKKAVIKKTRDQITTEREVVEENLALVNFDIVDSTNIKISFSVKGKKYSSTFSKTKDGGISLTSSSEYPILNGQRVKIDGKASDSILNIYNLLAFGISGRSKKLNSKLKKQAERMYNTFNKKVDIKKKETTKIEVSNGTITTYFDIDGITYSSEIKKVGDNKISITNTPENFLINNVVVELKADKTISSQKIYNLLVFAIGGRSKDLNKKIKEFSREIYDNFFTEKLLQNTPTPKPIKPTKTLPKIPTPSPKTKTTPKPIEPKIKKEPTFEEQRSYIQKGLREIAKELGITEPLILEAIVLNEGGFTWISKNLKKREAHKINGNTTDAEIKGTSWGFAQIMGSNYEKLGYSSPSNFKKAMTGENYLEKQLEAFKLFIKSVKGKRLINAINSKNYDLIATYYNGRFYKNNTDENGRNYAEKLKNYIDATEYYKNINATKKDIKKIQEALKLKPADGIFGPYTYRKLIIFQQNSGLTIDGQAGTKTLRKLKLITNSQSQNDFYENYAKYPNERKNEPNKFYKKNTLKRIIPFQEYSSLNGHKYPVILNLQDAKRYEQKGYLKKYKMSDFNSLHLKLNGIGQDSGVNSKYLYFTPLTFNTLKYITNKIHTNLDITVKISSGFRPKKYNEKINGSSDFSAHQSGNGFDISYISKAGKNIKNKIRATLKKLDTQGKIMYIEESDHFHITVTDPLIRNKYDYDLKEGNIRDNLPTLYKKVLEKIRKIKKGKYKPELASILVEIGYLKKDNSNDINKIKIALRKYQKDNGEAVDGDFGSSKYKKIKIKKGGKSIWESRWIDSDTRSNLARYYAKFLFRKGVKSDQDKITK